MRARAIGLAVGMDGLGARDIHAAMGAGHDIVVGGGGARRRGPVLGEITFHQSEHQPQADENNKDAEKLSHHQVKVRDTRGEVRRLRRAGRGMRKSGYPSYLAPRSSSLVVMVGVRG